MRTFEDVGAFILCFHLSLSIELNMWYLLVAKNTGLYILGAFCIDVLTIGINSNLRAHERGICLSSTIIGSSKDDGGTIIIISLCLEDAMVADGVLCSVISNGYMNLFGFKGLWAKNCTSISQCGKPVASRIFTLILVKFVCRCNIGGSSSSED